MKGKILAIALWTYATCALAAHFPLCMYGVNDPTDIPTLKKAGFTCIQSYQKDPGKLNLLAQAARRSKMQVVFYPNQVIGSDYQSVAQQWPMLAWYIVDEPDVWKWSRSRVSDEQNKTRIAFPQHKNALVIGQGKTTIPYYDLPDNLMMDWYPVPHLKLTSFGDNVRWAKEGQQKRGTAHRPLWGVVQIFDWKQFKQHRPDNDRIGRFPTKSEIRFMSYDGILNGATGLFYFTFNTDGEPLPKAKPEYWSRVTAVSKELSKLRPVLEQGALTENPLSFAAPLAAQTRSYKNYLYIILLNRSEESITVPAQLLDKSYKVLFGSSKTAQIPPYTVWVLKHKK